MKVIKCRRGTDNDDAMEREERGWWYKQVRCEQAVMGKLKLHLIRPIL